MDYTNWQPITPAEVGTLFTGLPSRWWIAGGWALDLYLGRQTRAHGDIDILVLRHDLPVVQAHLAAWQLWAADPPGTLRPWQPGERLAPQVHDIWARRDDAGPWAFQLLVLDADGDRWRFRRDPRITGTLATMGFISAEGLPCLAPEIQLLYKSKNPRPKDAADFANVLPQLSPTARGWLADKLKILYPDGHPWLPQLSP